MRKGPVAVAAVLDRSERSAGRKPMARGTVPGGLGSVRGERWTTEAEGVILGGLAAAARFLHPPGGGGHTRAVLLRNDAVLCSSAWLIA